MKPVHTVLAITLVASTEMTQNTLIGFDGDVCGEGKAAAGVTLSDVNANEAVAAVAIGVMYVVAGAAIEVGAAVQSNALGQAVPQADTGIVVGYAMDAAVAEGELIRILRGA